MALLPAVASLVAFSCLLVILAPLVVKLRKQSSTHYSSTTLPGHFSASNNVSEEYNHNSNYNFTWSLVTTIACMERYEEAHVLAYESWKRLRPPPAIIYVSTCRPSFARSANVITQFDRTSTGLPLFGGMMALSETLPTDLVAWTNADIMLSDDVTSAIQLLCEFHGQSSSTERWMAVAARRDLVLDGNVSIADIENNIKEDKLSDYLKHQALMHTQGGGDFFIWNDPHNAPIKTPYPPFIRSSCSWDNWWIYEADQLRKVVDVTAIMTIGHMDHAYFDHKNKNVDFQKTSSRSRWSQGVYADWRIYHNNAVARKNVYSRGFYTGLGAVKNLRTYVNNEGEIKTRETKNEPSAYSKSLKFPIFDNKGASKGIQTLKELLKDMPPSQPVLVTGATFGYVSMLMNWICNLRRLNMDNHYLVAAFDRNVFEYLYYHGVPVFLPEISLSSNKASSTSSSAFEYGQQAFKDTTKLKIASVSLILELGHDVIWSDSDIIFFKDFRIPIQNIHHDFVVQSNIPIPKIAGYYYQRVNSGFYFIRSKQSTIELVKQIISHSLASKKSEQMSFDAILCNLATEDYCLTVDKHLIAFFDYRKFPNGNVMQYWDMIMRNATLPHEVYILHNNWIKGYEQKRDRIIRSRQWFWDSNREVCWSTALGLNRSSVR